MVEGFTYMLRHADLRLILVLICAQTVVAGALAVFVVSIAFDLVDLGAQGVGYLDSALGLGALLGGFIAISRASANRLGGDFAVGVILWSLPLVLVAVWPTAAVALLVMAIIGLANPLVDVNLDTMLQRLTPDRLLARVFGTLESVCIGFMAVGAGLMPLLMEVFGIRWALAGLGLAITLVVVPALPGCTGSTSPEGAHRAPAAAGDPDVRPPRLPDAGDPGPAAHHAPGVRRLTGLPGGARSATRSTSSSPVRSASATVTWRCAPRWPATTSARSPCSATYPGPRTRSRWSTRCCAGSTVPSSSTPSPGTRTPPTPPSRWCRGGCWRARTMTAANLALGPQHAAYVPRLLPGWASASDGLAHRELDASLVMFDISGFTRLTERLSRQGRAGAEELSDVLHAVFTPLVAVAEDEGADLLKWGGDAVLLLLDGPDHALRAARAARGMHRVLGRVGHLRTSVGPVVLRASSGIHTGTVHLVLAGDPVVHRELMVVGPAASAVCRADAAAGAGQIVVTDPTAAALPPEFLGTSVAAGRLLLSHPVPTSATPPAPPPPAVPADLLATLLPPQLRVHLTQHESEPEHRMVAAAFLRFDGTDRLLAEQGPGRLAAAVDQLVRNVQDSVSRHGVSLHESDVDIEGGKLMLLAGAPLSTGDDVDHLVSAVRLVVGRAGELPLRAGVAHGRVFTGDLGPASRRTYSVKGHAVNLAARLAARAAPGEVLAPVELFEHAHRAFDLEVRPALTLKGVARPVITVVVGDPLEADALPTTTVMVGRERELGLLTAALDRLGGTPGASGGTGGVVEIVGEPGIGKSRLVGELASRAEDFMVLTAAADRSGLFTPYGAARGLLSRALGIAGVRDRAVAASRVRERVLRLAPELVERLPLLGAVLDIDLADEEGTVGAIDEQFRTEALHELVVDLLVAIGNGPTVLVVEDTHLLDPASSGILTRLAAEAQRRPWLVVITRRDDSDRMAPRGRPTWPSSSARCPRTPRGCSPTWSSPTSRCPRRRPRH